MKEELLPPKLPPYVDMKRRVLSDAKLIKRGADFDVESGTLELTNGQIERAKKEMKHDIGYIDHRLDEDLRTLQRLLKEWSGILAVERRMALEKNEPNKPIDKEYSRELRGKLKDRIKELGERLQYWENLYEPPKNK